MIIMTVMLSFISAQASRYSYIFRNTPLSEAIVRLSKDSPDLNISFIYTDLENYRTSAKIDTDDVYSALRQIIGLNPITVINKNGDYFVEVSCRGNITYTGTVTSDDSEPLPGATVMLLSPRDSSVITYGLTDENGLFSIPCNRKNALAKVACIGFTPRYISSEQSDMGKIQLRRIPIQLANLTVRADHTILASDKSIYIPTTRQKKASQNALDLLRRMAIPQLILTPSGNEVTDVFGNTVDVFINFQKAESDELSGMKMTDVRKVEYLEFPYDPRFKGAKRVVNFIVQEYEYGGYTKGMESFTFLNGIFNNTEAFSRFTVKRMTYDLYAGTENSKSHHTGTDYNTRYTLENDGHREIIERIETQRNSETRANTVPLTFRATYATPTFSARNTLSFTHFSAPEKSSVGDLQLNLYPEKNYSYARKSPNRNNTLYYQSNFWGQLGQKIDIDITPTFHHTHRNNTLLYESSLLQSPLHNLITENVYNYSVQASGRMVLNRKNQLALFIGGGQTINKLTYTGTDNSIDSYSGAFFAGEVRYGFYVQNFNLSVNGGIGYDRNSVNGIISKDVYPRASVNTGIALNKKSRLSAFVSYLTTTPAINLKANNIVQSNEYLYLTGNPLLKNWRNLDTNIAWNQFCSNAFSFAIFGGGDFYFNRLATIYKPYADGNALLRDYINDGTYGHYYMGVSANGRLFNNSLQLYANITQNFYSITGNYPDSCHPLRIQLQASYYWRAFSVVASWGNPNKTLTANSNYFIRGRNFHTLSVGWGNGDWTLKLAANNFFNKAWYSRTWQKESPLYSEFRRDYSPSSHANISLSATYTIGYGKTIRRGNEAAAQDAAPSAIID